MQSFPRAGRAGEPTLALVQAAGFPMGGETLAVDLADTLANTGDMVADLIGSQDACDRFWTIHAAQLPAGWSPPRADRVHRLRETIRAIFDALVDGKSVETAAVERLNEIAGLAPVTQRAERKSGTFHLVQRWHARKSADLPLAAAARSALELLTDPAARDALRRCSSPVCSMLFVKGDARRRWCTPNICANRDRAARFYRRHGGGD